MTCVTGKRRVPDPPARIMPFLLIASRSSSRGRVVAGDPVLVLAARNAREPVAVVEIPQNRLAHAGRERFRRRPVKLAADLRRVDRVAPIVTGTVRDERDLGSVVASRSQ